MTMLPRTPIRVAVLCDMAEEGWPSMDQMGNLLASRLPVLAPDLQVTALRHPMRRVASRGAEPAGRAALLADRLLNRMLLYPRRVRREAGRFDLYHVVDHSYAQLALDVPDGAAIVTCHDVDTFRCLTATAREPRPLWFRLMTRRILRGLRRAARVVCVSAAARDDLIRFGLADAGRLRVVPNGIDPGLLDAPGEAAARKADDLLGPPGTIDVLHVGNDIPRKRLDLAMAAVERLRARGAPARLVRVGSPLRPATRGAARALGAAGCLELPFLDREVLSAVYRRCALLLFPSAREGYGLPVVEAFAAGLPVVARDIPAIRESSGGLATLVASDDPGDWAAAVECVLRRSGSDAGAASRRRAHASALTWDAHVRRLLPVYDEVLSERGPARCDRTAVCEAAAP
jgi:glycosyltransferase involved in cell wall biosynthesis